MPTKQNNYFTILNFDSPCGELFKSAASVVSICLKKERYYSGKVEINNI